MNKYEGEINGKSKEERAEERDFQRLYSRVKEIILNNKNYSWGKSQELIEKSSSSTSIAESEIILNILERFYLEEGALPGQLEDEYINLLYSPEKITDRLVRGEDFYEVIKEINRETRDRGIILSSELVGQQIDRLKKNLELTEAA